MHHSSPGRKQGCRRRWLLQEVLTRLPGREWKLTRAPAVDVATLAELLRETAEHHDHYEKTHAEHHWWDWYAAYLSAHQNGSSPGEVATAADRYMEEALHVLPRRRPLTPQGPSRCHSLPSVDVKGR
jgi:hypothetical protein